MEAEKAYHIGVVEVPYLTRVIKFKEITSTKYLSEVENLTVVRVTIFLI